MYTSRASGSVNENRYIQSASAKPPDQGACNRGENVISLYTYVTASDETDSPIHVREASRDRCDEREKGLFAN